MLRLSLLVAMVLTLGACAGGPTEPSGSSSRPGAPIATGRSIPAPSESAPPPAGPSETTASIGWELAEYPWTGHSIALQAVAAGTDRIVAIGGSVCSSSGSQCQAGIWTAQPSAAAALERVRETPNLVVGDAHPTSGPSPGVFDVAAGPSGFVAIGYRGPLTGPIEAALWWSPNGVDWEPVETGPLLQGARPEAIVAGGPGYVVVGQVYEPDAPRAAVWSSSDGRTWMRAPDQAAFDIGGYIFTGELPGSGRMIDVAARGDDLVAIGLWCEGGAPGTCHSLVWESRDAVTWASFDPGLDAQGNGFAAIAGDPERAVAVGGTFQPSSAFSVTFAEGTTWDVSTHPRIPRLEAVVAIPGGFVAFTTAEAQLGAWISTDGMGWRALPGLPRLVGAQVIREVDATLAGDRLIIVGWAEMTGGFMITAPVRDVVP